MAMDKVPTSEEDVIEALEFIMNMSRNNAVLIISKLFRDNKKISEENEELKIELMRVEEDKAENEATYEKIINDYKCKLLAINDCLKDIQPKSPGGI